MGCTLVKALLYLPKFFSYVFFSYIMGKNVSTWRVTLLRNSNNKTLSSSHRQLLGPFSSSSVVEHKCVKKSGKICHSFKESCLEHFKKFLKSSTCASRVDLTGFLTKHISNQENGFGISQISKVCNCLFAKNYLNHYQPQIGFLWKAHFCGEFSKLIFLFFFILAVVTVMVATKIPTPWSNPIPLITIQTPRLGSV